MSITKEDIQALLDANNEVLKAQRAEENAALTSSFDEKIAAIEIPPAYVPPEVEKPKEGEESPAMKALMARHESDMASLSEEDKALVTLIGGEDILSQSAAFSNLQKAGKFKKVEVTPTEAKPKTDDKVIPPTEDTKTDKKEPPVVKPPTRLSLSSSNEKPKPKTWDEAGQRAAEAMQKISTT